MKISKQIVLVTLISSAMYSCKDENISKSDNYSDVKPIASADTSKLLFRSEGANFKQTGEPSLTSLVNQPEYHFDSKVNDYSNYHGYFRAEMLWGTPYTVNGTNLGSAGTVSLEKVNENGTIEEISTYKCIVSSWNKDNSGKIVFNLQVYNNTNKGTKPQPLPLTNKMNFPLARFKFVNKEGKVFRSSNRKFVPYVDGRQYGQCTWLVSLILEENGYKSGQVTYASFPVKENINEGYVPRAYDVWSWGKDVHQAILTSVKPSNPVVNTNDGSSTITYEIVGEEAHTSKELRTLFKRTVKIKTTKNGVKSITEGSFASGFKIKGVEQKPKWFISPIKKQIN